ncbi:uncharacterized protein LOC109713186 [Ananas comosus]|uniref:Uncharacterized protein LOC109713186 n=1 Tax=Ananas comosus TaxID=4615 RepID=A0A6P5FHY7_ANACO|nr:uncharacterized protein LOC109713186 [Ananas comosus]
MEEEPATKRRKLNNIQEEEDEDEKAARKADCISGLPDHLLHEILACLPTSIAVSTSLLSRRWRTLWRTSPDLSFTTHFPPSFVDSVLRLRDPAVPLRSFSLATPDYVVSDPARARSWIEYAAKYSALQHLRLKLVLTDSTPAFRSFRLPPAVFRLQHLRVLELQLPGVVPHLDWPATAFFPSLQRLGLVDLDLSLAAGDAISKSCPALKCWRMSLFGGPPQLDVNCPLLEVFELRTHVGLAGGRIRRRARSPSPPPSSPPDSLISSTETTPPPNALLNLFFQDYYYRMEGEPAAKRRRLNNIEKEEEEEDEKAAKKADCISGLPDHLLHEILACLPTSIAVRTSLLSRRWRTLWTTSPDLSFTTRLPPPFVDSVLRLRDPAVPLRSFSLSTSEDVVSNPARVCSWIDYAASNSALQHLKLKLVPTGRISAFCFFRLPEAVFRLQHLSVLELCLSRVIPHFIWPPTAFLPSLQRLDLADLNLSLVSRDAISNSCPALKYWRMSLYRAPPELDVSCPLLEVFELTMSLGTAGCVSICGSSVREVRVRQELARSAPAYLKLSAPALWTLEWVGPLPCAAAIADPLPPNLLTSSVVMRPGALNAYTDVNDVLLKADLSVLRVNQLVSSEPRITEVGISPTHPNRRSKLNSIVILLFN